MAANLNLLTALYSGYATVNISTIKNINIKTNQLILRPRKTGIESPFQFVTV